MNPDLDVFDDRAVYNGLTHEVGHWLGLAHTFEGNCSTAKISYWNGQASYNFSGDGVTDTPAHAASTFATSNGLSTCWQNMALNTCDDALGCDPGNDPVDNYMNVIPGVCYENYGRFTPGQRERMLIQYEIYRFRNITYNHLVPVIKSPAATCRKVEESCSKDKDCCGTLRCKSKRCTN